MELPQSLIEAHIKRGTILHSEDFEQIDHGKFFVVIGVTEKEMVGFFFINSNINYYIHDKQSLLDLQFPMRKSDYSFLRYDSFLNATNIMQMEQHLIIDGLKRGSVKFVGEVLESHMEVLLAHLRQSSLFNDVDKELFFG